MSKHVKTNCIEKSDDRWNEAIRDAQTMLERVESKADRLRRTITSLKEFRDAGEPWRGEQIDYAGCREASR